MAIGVLFQVLVIVRAHSVEIGGRLFGVLLGAFL